MSNPHPYAIGHSNGGVRDGLSTQALLSALVCVQGLAHRHQTATNSCSLTAALQHLLSTVFCHKPRDFFSRVSNDLQLAGTFLLTGLGFIKQRIPRALCVLPLVIVMTLAAPVTLGSVAENTSGYELK